MSATGREQTQFNELSPTDPLRLNVVGSGGSNPPLFHPQDATGEVADGEAG